MSTLLRQVKILEAYNEPCKKIAIGYKNFCDNYFIDHHAPYPDDDELWDRFMEKLAGEEKLHTA
jgi:hypothetical protein